MPTVQTWMTGAIKFAIEYKEPFWRNKGYSGMLYSHAGIAVEMYDHTNKEETKFGLCGFLNGSASSYSEEVRKELVIAQLQGLLGSKAKDYIYYTDKVWVDEFVYVPAFSPQRPHQNNGHPLLQQSFLYKKLLFCATETASSNPGYMEGAVVAAAETYNRIVHSNA